MDNSIMDKIIKVHFESDKYYCYGIQGLVQWDKCQKLEISGLDISDEIVEVHFSLDEVQGNAERMYGTVKDGVIHADIPTFILEGPEYICSGSEVYNAYAWVYVSDEESAETIRKMEFEIKAKPKPNGYASPDKQDPFLQEIRQVLTDTKQIAQSVRDDADAGKFNGNASINQEALLQLAIKPTTEKAPFQHITDSANMKVVDFGMEGKTEQKTTEGRNWISEKFSDYESGSYSATDGTKTDNVNAVRLKELIPVSNSIIYNYVESPVEGVTFLVRGYGENKEFLYNLGKLASGSTKFIQNDTKYLSISLINDDITMTLSDWKETFENGLKLYICSNTDNSTYEPYTNGPSPNPDFKQDIENAGEYNEATGRYEHRFGFVNENLLPNNPEKWDIGKMLYWCASKGTEVGWATRVYSAYTEIEIQPNTNICFHNDMTNKYWVSRIVETDSNRFGYSNHDLYTSIAKNYADYSFKTLSNTVKLLVEVRLVDDTQTFTEADLQEMKIAFGYGDSVIYTPHQSQPFTLTSPVPLTKWDKLVKRDGKWYWDYKQLKLVIDGTETDWFKYDSIKGFYLNNALSYSCYRIDGYCNQLRVVKDTSIVNHSLSLGANNKTIYCKYSSFYDSTLEDYGLANWKAHLKEHPLEIYTYKDESELVPLPEEEQTLLNNLETYYGVTNLYNDQGCPMWLTYVADTKLYTDQQIAKQIAQTQALILEN